MPAAAEPLGGCMADFQRTVSVHKQVMMLEAVGEAHSHVAAHVHCNTLVTLTTFLGCPSCICMTKECYQIGFLN